MGDGRCAMQVDVRPTTMANYLSQGTSACACLHVRTCELEKAEIRFQEDIRRARDSTRLPVSLGSSR